MSSPKLLCSCQRALLACPGAVPAGLLSAESLCTYAAALLAQAASVCGCCVAHSGPAGLLCCDFVQAIASQDMVPSFAGCPCCYELNPAQANMATAEACWLLRGVNGNGGRTPPMPAAVLTQGILTQAEAGHRAGRPAVLLLDLQDMCLRCTFLTLGCIVLTQ